MAELTHPHVQPLSKIAIARSVLITIVIAVSILHALPAAAIKREQLASFEKRMGTPLTDLVEHTSQALIATRRVLLSPFVPVMDRLGMAQRWSLFAMRGIHGYKIQIEALGADMQWRVIYRAHETDEIGISPQLTYRRMRGIYNPRNKEDERGQYETMVSWIGHDLLARHPEYLGVKVSMQKLRLGSREAPSQVLDVEHVAEVYREGTR